ncbi:MAG: NYN domain-containing protein, partial [Coleofasciculus sp. S288]|nr:NYN domain-containing protein [Coleofasciculus sp. S288]
MPSTLYSPEALNPPIEEAAPPAQFPPGIAILLLDAENLKLDTNAEKFLAELCHYQLQVKIAFANWRNPTIGKQDAELYERGYQLLHAPGGKNSADAQMIVLGASISRHYPNAREVFVCSSDWLLTNLCNELQNQGLTVYRVRRHNSTLSVENRNTQESKHYSLALGTEIPSIEELAQKIEELLKLEHELIHERIARVSAIANLFQERQRLTLNGTHASASLM